jgi:biotin synthase
MPTLEKLCSGEIADRVLGGEELSRQEAAEIVNCPNEWLGDLLLATRKVREAHFGNRVKICMLRNAQSGICPEDCGYCSQSRISKADIPVYKL